MRRHVADPHLVDDCTTNIGARILDLAFGPALVRPGEGLGYHILRRSRVAHHGEREAQRRRSLSLEIAANTLRSLVEAFVTPGISPATAGTMQSLTP